ncbi:hypothetical protein PMAYCL1PPCAC_21372, partial [Pristionchus mayeri]
SYYITVSRMFQPRHYYPRFVDILTFVSLSHTATAPTAIQKSHKYGATGRLPLPNPRDRGKHSRPCNNRSLCVGTAEDAGDPLQLQMSHGRDDAGS